MKKYDEVYDDLINQIPDANILPQAAELLANRFFKAMYNIGKDLRDARSNVTILKPVNSISYCEAIKNADGKNVTEKKVIADADELYLESVTAMDEAVEEVEYLKDLYETVQNGFVFFRQLSNQK